MWTLLKENKWVPIGVLLETETMDDIIDHRDEGRIMEKGIGDMRKYQLTDRGALYGLRRMLFL